LVSPRSTLLYELVKDLPVAPTIFVSFVGARSPLWHWARRRFFAWLGTLPLTNPHDGSCCCRCVMGWGTCYRSHMMVVVSADVWRCSSISQAAGWNHVGRYMDRFNITPHRGNLDNDYSITHNLAVGWNLVGSNANQGYMDRFGITFVSWSSSHTRCIIKLLWVVSCLRTIQYGLDSYLPLYHSH
jgi:hypothetical protein